MPNFRQMDRIHHSSSNYYAQSTPCSTENGPLPSPPCMSPTILILYHVNHIPANNGPRLPQRVPTQPHICNLSSVAFAPCHPPTTTPNYNVAIPFQLNPPTCEGPSKALSISHVSCFGWRLQTNSINRP